MLSSGPHFLGIGAQKAGTTWLWTQLNQHADIWMPRRKEIHYFDRHQPANYLSEPSVWRRLTGGEAHHQEWRKCMWADLRAASRQRNWANFRWYARFFFGAMDDRWYQSLFTAKAVVRGEITPAYSKLDEPAVAHIAHLFPDLKIILLLRNPIERAWSQVRFDWTRGARSSIENLREIEAFIDSPPQELRSDYLRMLDFWGRHFSPEQIFIGFHEEITEQPAELLGRVLRFLGLDPARSTAHDLGRKVHPSREADMPPEIHLYLCRKYQSQLEGLAQRFGPPASSWLASAQAVLATASV